MTRDEMATRLADLIGQLNALVRECEQDCKSMIIIVREDGLFSAHIDRPERGNLHIFPSISRDNILFICDESIPIDETGHYTQVTDESAV